MEVLGRCNIRFSFWFWFGSLGAPGHKRTEGIIVSPELRRRRTHGPQHTDSERTKWPGCCLKAFWVLRFLSGRGYWFNTVRKPFNLKLLFSLQHHRGGFSVRGGQEREETDDAGGERSTLESPSGPKLLFKELKWKHMPLWLRENERECLRNNSQTSGTR